MNTALNDKKRDTSNRLLVSNLSVILTLQFVMLFIKEGWNYRYQDFFNLLDLLLRVTPDLLAKSLGHLFSIIIISVVIVGIIGVLNKTNYLRRKYHFSVTCWIIFLLSTHSQAMAMGFFSIVFWFFAAVTGLIIFWIANKNKMTGWIAISSFCVFWLFIGVIGFVFAFVNKTASVPPVATNWQTVQGDNASYSIQIPAEWKIEHKTADDYDIFAHNKSLYIAVATGEVDYGSSETAADQILEDFKQRVTDLKVTDRTSFVLDGRNWMQFTAHCRFDNIPITYLIYIYSGSEGLFEIVGWTSQNLFDRDVKLMRELMQTFHLVKKPDAPVNTAVPPVKLSIKEATDQFYIGTAHYRNKEYAEAYKAWKPIADANILEAYNNLGHLNYYGLGVEKNQQEGVRLWRIAASNGFPESQIHLSDAYFDGDIVPKDLIEAYAWAKAADYFADPEDESEDGDKHKSQKLIEQYSKKLSKNMLKQAESRARSLILTISETIKSTQYIWLFPIPKSEQPTLPVPATKYGVKNS
jgi:hypothetical protein